MRHQYCNRKCREILLVLQILIDGKKHIEFGCRHGQ